MCKNKTIIIYHIQPCMPFSCNTRYVEYFCINMYPIQGKIKERIITYF